MKHSYLACSLSMALSAMVYPLTSMATTMLDTSLSKVNSASLTVNNAIVDSPLVNSQRIEQSQSTFQALRTRWAESFLGDPAVAFDDTLNNMVTSTNIEANKHWVSMLTGNERKSLWSDLVLDDQSEAGKKVLGANIRSSYQRLLAMAKAYRLRDGVLQNNAELLNDITASLSFLGQNYYKPGVEEWGNWWHWELGTPRDVHNILVLLYDDLPQSLIVDQLAATRYFTPEATHLGAGSGAGESSNPTYRESTGGNRTDNTLVVLIRGILDNSATEIEAAIGALPPVLEVVESSDGFYSDGSFIQHYDIAYNGTYGNVLLNGLGRQINLVAGSPWAATDPSLKAIYPIIFNSYAPLLYRGTMMEFVNGRAISRPKEQGHDVGHSVMWSLLHYVDGASVDDKIKLQSMLKHLINEDTFKSFFTSTSNVVNYQKAVAIMQDSLIPEQDELIGNFSFPAMDRVIHRRDDWVFSLAMHSSRLGNFECMNNENRKGWFTGDGMTYLYNDQLDHYNDFWPVVDSGRLEGTTVDSQPMAECGGQRNQLKHGRKLNMDWVGTLSAGEFGVAGMDFVNWDDTLQAKKSWFMLEDSVVMLGSDISSSIDSAITTVVANRKVAQVGETKIRVNGKKWQPKADNMPHTMARVSSLSIRNKSLDDSDLSYVFLSPTAVTLKQQMRSGDWADIGNSKGEVHGDFITAEITQDSQHDSYAYVMLLDADRDDVKDYVEEPEIRVIRNDNQAHAIYDRELKLLAANIWRDQPVQIGKRLTTYSKMSIMIRKQAGRQQISVSNPLQSQLELRFSLNKLVRIISDPQDRVQQSADGELVVNVAGLKGQGYAFTVK